MALALCHTVEAEELPKEEQTERVKYSYQVCYLVLLLVLLLSTDRDRP